MGNRRWDCCELYVYLRTCLDTPTSDEDANVFFTELEWSLRNKMIWGISVMGMGIISRQVNA